MIQKIKIPAIVLTFGIIAAWAGNSIFQYATYDQQPKVVVKGLQHDGSYNGVVACSLNANNGYKVSSVHMVLDGKDFDFGVSPNVSAKNFDIPFELDTTTLEDGKHTLEVISVDSSYHQNRAHDTYEFNVDNVPLKVAFLQPNYKVDQGRTLHVKIQTNKKLEKAQLSFLDENHECYPETPNSKTYECFIAIDCENRPGESMITTDVQDHVGNKVKITAQAEILKFPFKKQKTNLNISTKKLDEEKEISMNTKILRTAIKKWAENSPKKKLWSGRFEFPTQVQRVATPHGEIRITPERGRYMHKGIDIVNYPKKVVWASQNGTVIIKDRFLLTGNTVVIDHGLGVATLYAHLNDFTDIEIGDTVKKGNPIGRIGMTGYATGYHLHWELLVNGVAVDPLEWTKKVY